MKSYNISINKMILYYISVDRTTETPEMILFPGHDELCRTCQY